MKLKNNYLLFFLLTILICCKTLKSPQNKTTYYHYDDFTRVSEKLVLYNDNTFFFKSRDVCNNEDYFGIWRIDNDTIYMQVTKPNIYKTNLSYKVIERENDSIQHIIITDKYEGFGFVGWVNINDSINTEEFIAGTDSSGVYKVYPKRKIKKLSIYGGNPYPTFSIEFNILIELNEILVEKERGLSMLSKSIASPCILTLILSFVLSD